MAHLRCFIVSALVAVVAACGGSQGAEPTSPDEPVASPTAEPVGEDPGAPEAPLACEGEGAHVANGECFETFDAACAALACEEPLQCVSLETYPAQADCQSPPEPASE